MELDSPPPSITTEPPANVDFEEAYRQFVPKIVAYLTYKLNGDQDTAEDLAQEALHDAYKKWEQFDPSQSSISSWLFGFAQLELVEHLRSNNKSPVISSIHDQEEHLKSSLESEENWEELLDRENIRSAFHEAVHELPKKQREIVIYKLETGKKKEEIAEDLKLPLGTVKSRLYRAIQALIGILKRKGLI